MRKIVAGSFFCGSMLFIGYVILGPTAKEAMRLDWLNVVKESWAEYREQINIKPLEKAEEESRKRPCAAYVYHELISRVDVELKRAKAWGNSFTDAELGFSESEFQGSFNEVNLVYGAALVRGWRRTPEESSCSGLHGGSIDFKNKPRVKMFISEAKKEANNSYADFGLTEEEAKTFEPR